MQSREYVKRIWRVPKDRGPAEFLGSLVLKALVKHGWPARLEPIPGNFGDGFQIVHKRLGHSAQPDFWDAVTVACRVVAKTHRVQWVEHRGLVVLSREYLVTPSGFVREVKQGETWQPSCKTATG
jgi:hypothetical protein